MNRIEDTRDGISGNIAVTVPVPDEKISAFQESIVNELKHRDVHFEFRDGILSVFAHDNRATVIFATVTDGLLSSLNQGSSNSLIIIPTGNRKVSKQLKCITSFYGIPLFNFELPRPTNDVATHLISYSQQSPGFLEKLGTDVSYAIIIELIVRFILGQ